MPAILAGIALVVGAPTVSAAPPERPGRAVAGELLVGFAPGVNDVERRDVLRGAGVVERRRFGAIRGALVATRSDGARARLASDPRVRYVEPNYVVEALDLPDDPHFDRLWGLRNTGQPVNGWPGTPDADADVDEAWDVTSGAAGVVVAVIDTGVDQSHPDLAANTWVNPGENCTGCRTDGEDNDGNGYVDDWRGWDFAGDDNDPADDHGHGTHVAGTIGAVRDNALGVAGVSPRVSLMGLKFLGANGSGTTADAVEAVLYAAANGADVLNNSWAGGEYSQSLRDAIAFADERDSLFVAAAGNSGMDNDALATYPASYDVPNVLAVAASDNNDRHAFFSNLGASSVDLSAPGVSIFSTWPGSTYQYASGTSMAAPHVAGAAALVEAVDPSASDVGVKTLLLRSADPVAALAGLTATGGRLNARAAVECDGRPLVWLDAPGAGFELELGGTIAVSASATSCAAPGGVHVSANVGGTPVTLAPRGDGHYVGTFTPTAGGPLAVTVTASNGAGTDVRTVNGAVHQVYPIVPGGPPVTVTTTAAGQDSRLAFDGDAGDRISLQLRDVTMAPTIVRIHRPDGGLLGSEAYVGKSGLFVDARTLPVSGRYRIELDAQPTAVGSITLELYDVPPDASASIAPGGAPVTLETTVPGQNARATFSAAAGERVSLRVSSVTVKSVVVTLMRGTVPLGSAIAGAAGGFMDVETLPADGEYALVVNPQISYTGSLTLTLYDVPPDARSPIEPDGSPAAVTVAVPGQNARLAFGGAAGERFAVAVGSGFSSAYVSIVGPGGTVGARTLVGPSGGLLDPRTLTESGPHEVLIDPHGMGTGSTSVRLYAVPPDVELPIEAGEPVSVSTSAPGQNARLHFDAAAGDRVSLQLSGVSISSAYVSIYGPDGAAVARNVLVRSGGGFVDARALVSSGRHTILVDPIDASTGSMTLLLHEVPPDVVGVLGTGGPPLTVALSTPGQNAQLTFSGVAGSRVSLVVSAVTIPSSVVTILRPNGSTQAAAIVGTAGRTFTLDLGATGTYVVLVDPRAAATGSATLRLSPL